MNFSVLVGSCDKYSFLWDNFFTMYERNTNFYDYPHFLVSESKNVPHQFFNFVNTGEGSWSEMILSGLENVKTEYVFFILDDYFLTEYMNLKEIEFHIDFAKEMNANKVVVGEHSLFYKYKNTHYYKGRNALKFDDYSNYLTTTQPAIWRVDFFKDLLDKKMNPWEFEIKKTREIHGLNNKIYLMLRENKIYFNAFNKGKPCEGYDSFIDNNNLHK